MSRRLFQDLWQAALGFALVSLAAFSVWAYGGPWFRHAGGELGMYAAITLVFLGLSGPVLGPLAGGVGRFYRAFLPAFLAYAALWCLAWFGLHGRLGEWVGAGAGCLAFSWITQKRLASTRGWIWTGLGVFALHSAGYFAGDAAMYDFWVPKAKLEAAGTPERQQFMTFAKLSWGLCYGLGFGAGLGWLFHRVRVAA